MDYAALYSEITTDPLGKGYASMAKEQIAESLNAETRTRNRERMEPTEIINAVVLAEWAAVPAGKQQTIWNLLHMGALNPFGIEATLFVDAFGANSATIQALAKSRVQAISRAQELGLPVVAVGHIPEAIAYGERANG
jgi:hypothetical protein